MKKYLAMAAVAATVAFAAVFYPSSDDDTWPPRDVVGAFVYHLDHGNFGKACGLYAGMGPAAVERCSAGLIFNAGQSMLWGGVDIFDNARIVPGLPLAPNDTTRVYWIESDEIPPTSVRVELQESGRWRITAIGES